MFEHIVLRRSDGDQPISAGTIAEALLYYQKVHLFIDRSTILELIQQIGGDLTLALLKRPSVSAVYCEEILCTVTNNAGVSQYHNFSAATLGGHKDGPPLKTHEERLRDHLMRQGILGTKTARFCNEFLKMVPVRKFSGNHFIKGGIEQAAKRDVLDFDFAKQALRVAIARLTGGYETGLDFKFEVIQSPLGLFVFPGLDLNVINSLRAKMTPPMEGLTVAHLLNRILEARADLILASHYGGEFVTSEVTSAIIQVHHAELLRRSQLSVEARQQFTEVVLPDSPSVAEVIDSKQRSFKEFLELLDRADRFKNWLGKVNPDEGLIRTYTQDVASKGWIERLPAKTLRYVFTTCVDKFDPVAGLVAGFTDNFLIEKLLSGWRPNHFISAKLSPFVKGK